MPREKSLTVVHVANQLRVGGMEKLLVDFARHADRSRFDLHFVSLTDRGPLATDIEACGWPVTALNVPSGLRPGLVVRLATLFRKLGTDVVHTHNTKPLLYGAPAARMARVRRVIHTRHGRRSGAPRRAPAAFRVAASLTDRFVCVSEDCRQLSIAEGVNPRRLDVIRNGIDLSRFRPVGPAPGGPAVLVSRLSPEKDVPTLLRAVALVARDLPTFRLEIAGDGPSLPGLREMAAALGLEARVTFLGAVREVPELLARASLFVLPSLTEGISLALLEAMSTGLPVVTTRVGGNPEVVEDGRTGLLVPTEASAELADAILRLARDSGLARQMGLAGRARVEAQFDIRGAVSAYEALLAVAPRRVERRSRPAGELSLAR